MRQVGDLAIGDVRARRRKFGISEPRHVGGEHPVECAMRDIDGQARKPRRLRHAEQHRMPRGRHGREMRERSARQSREISEGAAVAHAGEKNAARVHMPPLAHMRHHPRQRRAVLLRLHQGPCGVERCRADENGPARARVHEPRPEKAAPMSAAAVTGDDQRMRAGRVICLRHVKRKAAAAPLVVAEMMHARFLARRSRGERRHQCFVVPSALLEEEPAHRRQHRAHRIKRFHRARPVPHRPVDAEDRAAGR